SKLGGLLLAPIRNLLNHQRLLVVADDCLQYIPFAALTDELTNPSQAFGKAEYLISSHQVVNLPSLSTVAVLRSRHTTPYAPGKQVAVLADPVFDREDPR